MAKVENLFKTSWISLCKNRAYTCVNVFSISKNVKNPTFYTFFSHHFKPQFFTDLPLLKPPLFHFSTDTITTTNKI